MKKQLGIALGMLLLSSFAQAQGPGGSTAAGKYTPRGQAVHDIVLKWAPHVQEAYKVNPTAWAKGMASTFAKADIATLERAALANNFDSMNAILLGARAKTASATQAITPTVFGDANQDLVYVPLTPCRIIDTRVAGGVIAANTIRSFDVTAVSSYSFQGGDASNCGGAGAAGSFAAAVINFTVVTPSAAGYITAFPFGATQPLAATLNYTSGDIKGNEVIVRLDQGASANELSVYTFAQTHLVADIVGYFRNPGTLAFECVDTADTVDDVAAGATRNTTAPTCASGYTQTATNCEASTWQMPFVFISGGVCSAQNNSAGTAQLRASRTCCRARYN
jgi:hypothetical protein